MTTKEKLWSALTDARKLSLWWNKGVKLEPVVGGAFYEPWGKGQLATGTVLAVDPLRSIQFTWREKDWLDHEITTCTFSLLEKEGKTILSVRHEGWESFKGTDKLSKVYLAFKNGWDFYLSQLKKYIETKK